jgi:hypothetical protein
MVKHLVVVLSLLLSFIAASSVNSGAADSSGVPQQLQQIQAQLQAVQDQLTTIQNALGTQGTGLTSLATQLQTLQTTVDGQGTKLTSIQSALTSVAKTRKFYLTDVGGGFDGSQAATACVSGFHMASLWEIFDTSNLLYDTTNGLIGGVNSTETGPPNFFIGWIREGGASVGSEPNTTPGQRDCIGYTSADSGQHGTVAALSSDFGSSSGGINPWKGDSKTCDTKLQVWCVQN